MLYQIIDGTLSVGSQEILSKFQFEIKGQDKIAIVGKNGSGKTTLLRLLAGELSLDRDDTCMHPAIRLARNVTIGMLKQHPFDGCHETVEEILCAACPCKDTWDRERFLYEQEYDRLFTGFGFKKEDKEKPITAFSGGQQTKIAMIQLLLEKPDILLLDEPTNHLDLESVIWLETYLKSYSKAVVIVSHDRYFLDQTVQIVYEISQKKLTRYAGNYTAYRTEKRKQLAKLKKQFNQQQQEIKELEALIERFKNKPKKAAFARSRKKLLERMKKIEMPVDDEMSLTCEEIIPERTGGKWVYEAEKLHIGYDQPLMSLSLRIKRGQKIGIIGPNGVGKSTFLKTVAEKLMPLSGKSTLGMHTDMAYFDQLCTELPQEQTILAYFKSKYPALHDKEARDYLAGWLFKGADVMKMLKHLSGGERARLVLAVLLAERPNFLILDEPTNHMDIFAKEALETIFKAYKGTILFVSHDRYFIQEIADTLFVFENGQATVYPFGYGHYLSKKQEQEDDEVLLPGELSTKDRALLDGLKQVPKGASIGKALSEEQIFMDWQLRLAREAIDSAFEKARLIKEKESDAWWQDEAVLIYAQEQTALAEEELNKACLAWYDLWLYSEEYDEILKEQEMIKNEDENGDDK